MNSRSTPPNEKCIQSNLKMFIINCRVICKGIYLDLQSHKYMLHMMKSQWKKAVKNILKAKKQQQQQPTTIAVVRDRNKTKMKTKNKHTHCKRTFAIWNYNSHRSLNQCLSAWIVVSSVLGCCICPSIVIFSQSRVPSSPNQIIHIAVPSSYIKMYLLFH